MKRSGTDEEGRSGGRRRRRGRKRRSSQADADFGATVATAEVDELATEVAETTASNNGLADADDVTTDADSLLDLITEEAVTDDDELSPPTTGERIDENAAEQVALLTGEVQEKDELISALTDQLEEAANRLDRMQRAGADRAPLGGSGASFGASELQGGISDQIGRLSDAWSDLQAEDRLSEISRKLDDLRNVLSRTQVGSRRDLGDTATFEMEPSAATGSREPESQLAGWEEMKAELLRENQDRHQEQRAAKTVAADLGAPGESHAAQNEPLDDPPAPLDLDEADDEELKAAIEERDEFISQLIRRLRSTPAGRYEPIDWEALNNAPDDLRQRLQELESQLQELLRMEECELSLERARLARESAQLQHLSRDAQRDDRRNGEEEADSPTSQSERRWLRVFGFGKKPADDEDEIY